MNLISFLSKLAILDQKNIDFLKEYISKSKEVLEKYPEDLKRKDPALKEFINRLTIVTEIIKKDAKELTKEDEINANNFENTYKEFIPIFEAKIKEKEEKDKARRLAEEEQIKILEQQREQKRKEREEKKAPRRAELYKDTLIYNFKSGLLTRYWKNSEVEIVGETNDAFYYMIKTSEGDLFLVAKKDIDERVKPTYYILLEEIPAIEDISSKEVKLPKGMLVRYIRKQTQAATPYWLIEDPKTDAKFKINEKDAEKFLQQKNASLNKNTSWLPRDYPEANDVTIDTSKIQEHPFDRWSPGTGSSYLSFPNTGDTVGDRTNTRGYAGEAEFFDKANIENLSEAEKKKKTYEFLLNEAISKNTSKELIRYYQDKIHETEKRY